MGKFVITVPGGAGIRQPLGRTILGQFHADTYPEVAHAERRIEELERMAMSLGIKAPDYWIESTKLRPELGLGQSWR